jgi:hypothetical protein
MHDEERVLDSLKNDETWGLYLPHDLGDRLWILTENVMPALN